MIYKDVRLNTDEKTILLNTDRSAREYAKAAHGDQTYGQDLSYVYHLDHVYELAKGCVGKFWTGTELRLIEQLSYLHDVLEDTSVTEEQLAEHFGVLVMAGVKILTDEPGKNRRERKSKMNTKLGSLAVTPDGMNRFVLIVKVADRLANVMNCIRTQEHGLWRMYAKEYSEFKAAAYRPGLCDDLWERLDLLMDKTSEALFDVYTAEWLTKQGTRE